MKNVIKRVPCKLVCRWPNANILSKKLIFGLMLACSLTACNDDFINISNPNQQTSDGFFQTEKDMDEAHIACYGTLYFQGIFGQWYDLVFEMRADLCYNESAWRDYANFSKFQYPSTNWECISYCWNHYYQGINMLNNFLAHIDDENIKMDDVKRRQYKGEVSFLRALYYFNLYHLYGPNLLLITEPMNEVQFPASSTEEAVWNQIFQDLDVALKAELPNVREDAELGRITRGAVLAMIGKAHMQRHEWQEAADAFKQIIDSNIYRLTDNYFDNFDLEHEFNSESVFEVAFTDATKGTWTEFGSSQSPSTTQRARYFAPRDVGGHSDAQPNYFYLQEFVNNSPVNYCTRTADNKVDSRRRASILYYPTQTLYGKTYLELGGAPEIDEQYPKIWSIKYSNGTWRTWEDEWSPINLRIIRYADVLLMYAEALNNLGRTSEAYQYIDQVRGRQSVNLAKLSTVRPNMTQAEMQDQIEHERILELGSESVRWFDIFRWGYLDTQEGKAKLLEHDYEFRTFRPGIDKFLPIPQNECDLNPNLRQNEGF